ncbi:MAG: histidine kinase [Bacteroidia bacterium]|nr:histidine kinase [Bacteroidia bacterium]
MKKNTLYWICQIGSWLLFVLLEYIGYGNVYGYNQLLLLNVVINFFAGVILTHLYRLFIIKTSWINLPVASLIPRAVLGIVFISILMTLLNIKLDRMTIPLMSQLPIDAILILNYLFTWCKYILFWALVYHLFQYWERSLEAEKVKYQLQATIKENQYQNLKTQLNPHFLFNSLNSIRTLVDVDPTISKEAITRLSNLLRSSLQMSKQRTVALKREIETVNDYLSIEKIRFDERLQIIINLSAETLDTQVPPMMLQTLVENAVKHGISKSKNGGQIIISSTRSKFFLNIEIINTGSLEPTVSETGVGIANTLERLQILYDSRAHFSIENMEGNKVLTKINIPI